MSTYLSLSLFLSLPLRLTPSFSSTYQLTEEIVDRVIRRVEQRPLSSLVVADECGYGDITLCLIVWPVVMIDQERPSNPLHL